MFRKLLILLLTLVVQMKMAQSAQAHTARTYSAPISKFVFANGINIHYLESGAGETPLVLLHGGGLTAASWAELARDASKNYHVFAIDSRGHGETANPAKLFSYDLLTADVVGFVSALGLEKPLLVGYSDGGIVALTVAMQHPDLPLGVVACGAAPIQRNTSHYLSGMKLFFTTPAVGLLSEKDFEMVQTSHPATVEKYKMIHHPAGAGTDYWKVLLSTVWPAWTSPAVYEREQLSKITAKALILIGDRDEFFTVTDAVKTAEAIPNSELAVAPGETHLFFHDNPKLFDRLVLSFLNKITALR